MRLLSVQLFPLSTTQTLQACQKWMIKDEEILLMSETRAHNPKRRRKKYVKHKFVQQSRWREFSNCQTFFFLLHTTRALKLEMASNPFDPYDTKKGSHETYQHKRQFQNVRSTARLNSQYVRYDNEVQTYRHIKNLPNQCNNSKMDKIYRAWKSSRCEISWL